jgi:hypothetical protein
MAATPRATIPTQMRKLRQALSSSVGRTLELERQVQESQQKESQLPLDVLAVAVMNSVRQAEEATALLGEGYNRYAVAEVQTTLKGFIDRTDDGLAVRLARSEQNIRPELLSSITLTFTRLPSLENGGGIDTFAAATEEAQAAFGAWHPDEAGKEVDDLLTRVTQLWAQRDAWGDVVFTRSVRGLAESAIRCARALRRIPKQALRDFRSAADALGKTARALEEAGITGQAAMEGLAGPVGTLAARFRDLSEDG